MQSVPFIKGRQLLISTALAVGLSGVVQAQSASEAFLEEILVTATKRTGGISVQDAGVAVTAYNENQIDAMHLRDIAAIGFSAPNVQLEDIGTTRGTANFSIRGLGINSSIPTIDPTVGVFVDGMYLGLNAGVVFDTFDLEGIEVLRGPQGLLFGRNVTGGAVLLRTGRPTDEFTFKAKAAFETGNNKYLSAVVSGPLSETLTAKFAAYVNDDGGWFTNLANGNDNFGQSNTTLVRGAFNWTPTDNFDLMVRAEFGQSDGDGPASQNAGLFAADSFDFAIDEEGFYDSEWNQIIAEATIDVEFGEGQIVNILGYRDYESATRGDIDATPSNLFHSPSRTIHDQISNEFRYNGTFGKSYLTTGVYVFSQKIDYREQRELLVDTPAPPPTFNGGGVQNQDTIGVFAHIDYTLTDLVTLNIGGRYTKEEKDVQVATIFVPAATGSGCTLAGCVNFDFVDKDDWNSFTPKIGLQFAPDDETQWYAFWTKGFRSGGYNVRHTSLTDPNQGFDQEEQNTFEFGLKKDFYDGKLRVNAAAFHNQIDDMQREVNLPSAVAGVVQLIRNTADATIVGGEVEVDWAISDSFFLKLTGGYVDGSYDAVRFDLNGDGMVDGADLALDLPRLAKLSYGAQLFYDKDLSFGTFHAQVSGYRRDPSAYTDNNLGQLRAADMFDISMSLGLMDDALNISIFGRNLKDESTIGGDTQLPFFPGATFSPLNKGRTYGAEVKFSY